MKPVPGSIRIAACLLLAAAVVEIEPAGRREEAEAAQAEGVE